MGKLKAPIVSVVMAVYKESLDHIRQSVESIINQTYRSFEFVIVLDNPDYNDAIQLLESYVKTDHRIRLLYNKGNRGLAYSSNRAIASSKGSYIARMDADDVAVPHRLEKQLSYMQNNSATDLVFSWVDYIDQEGKMVKKFTPEVSKVDDLRKYFFTDILFAHPTLMAKKDILVGNPYDPSFRRSQDFELWLRLICDGRKFAILAESLLEYRIPACVDTKTRVRKVRQSTYWTLKALWKHIGSYWNNLFYWLFCIKTVILCLISRLPYKILKIFV